MESSWCDDRCEGRRIDRHEEGVPGWGGSVAGAGELREIGVTTTRARRRKTKLTTTTNSVCKKNKRFN